MPTSLAHPRLMAALLAAVLVSAACSGGGDKTPSTSPAQAITISATTALDLTQGGSATIAVTIARTGGFTGDVAVTVEGLPAGVTASALTITSASTTGNIALTALATAVVAGSNLTVRGSGSGISSATAGVALNVRAAAGAAITLSTAASTLDLTQGATALINVTITRTGGFAGDVAVTVEGLPTGVTASALTITSANTSGSVTLTALLTAVVTGTNLTVRGSGTGITSVTAAVALNVRAATGAVSVVFSPPSLTIIQGATVNVTATITRTGGFTGGVTFTVTGLPTGLTVAVTQTASVNQTVVTSNSANFAFTASNSLAVGAYPVSIVASGTGVTSTSVNFSTQVNAPVAGNSVVATFCPAFGIPDFVAYQDGTTAAWQRATVGANNTYTFAITQPKGGVAYEFHPNATTYQLFVVYGTQTELQSQFASICLNQGQTGRSLNGALIGITGTDIGYVGMGTSAAQVTSASGSGINFTLNNVPNGVLDIIASRTTLTINGSNFTSALASILVRRNVNIPGSGFTISPSLDVSPISGEAVTPVNRNLTLNGLSGDMAFLSLSYLTGNGTSAPFYSEFSASAAAAHVIPTMPATKIIAGDYHYASALAQLNFTSQAASTRVAGKYFTASADQTINLGPTPSPVTVSNGNFQAPVQLNSTWARQTEYGNYFFVSYSQSGAAPRFAQVSATAAYVGSATSINLNMPNLVPAGYTANWGLQPQTATAVQAGAAGWSAPGGVGSSPAVDGGTYQLGFRALSYTP